MHNIKKINTLQLMIKHLSEQVESLKKENDSMSFQLSEFAAREKQLAEKELRIDEMRKTYEGLINEVDILKGKYSQLVKDVCKAKYKYIGELKKQISRISKQK